MISSAILAVLSMIEAILPMISGTSATATMIVNAIAVLEKLMPYIVGEIETVYTAVKNIIAQLQTTGAPTPDQLTALQSLDTQVDSAWDALQPEFDPDAVPSA